MSTTGLFRFRSPLLAESRLMSFPPGTEMFQFPGFALLPYGFRQKYPCGWVAPFGYPRIKARSRLPVAFRSVPRPSSPPGAKASTECPSHARYAFHPAQEPWPAFSDQLSAARRKSCLARQSHRTHDTARKPVITTDARRYATPLIAGLSTCRRSLDAGFRLRRSERDHASHAQRMTKRPAPATVRPKMPKRRAQGRTRTLF